MKISGTVTFEKGGLYGSCAELYLNDQVKGSFYISECFEQTHHQSSIDHWGIELVLEIITFRHATFRSTQNFTSQEEQYFKSLIREHFKNSKNCDETFFELIERTALANRYMSRRAGRYKPNTSVWLNLHCAH